MKVLIGQYFSSPLGRMAANYFRRDARDAIFKFAYLSLQMLDLGLTLLAAQLGFPEFNPMMKASLNSPLQLAVFKLGIPLLISWLVPGKFLIPAIGFLCGVVGWNLKELLMLWF
jgi:hypothetical protein